jgi:hypothetical protein
MAFGWVVASHVLVRQAFLLREPTDGLTSKRHNAPKSKGYRECMTQMNTQVRTLIFPRLKPGLEQIRYAQGEKERG